MGYRVLIACSKPSVGLPWLFWALVTSWYFEFKIRCNTFFSPFLKLLDCCWIVFLLPQGTNWAIQRSATKQTDADEMRGSTFHWYLVSNNPDDVFANATDEQQRRLGLVVVCSAICQLVEFPNFLPQHYFLPCQPCQRRLVYFHSSWKPPVNYSPPPPFLSAN